MLYDNGFRAVNDLHSSSVRAFAVVIVYFRHTVWLSCGFRSYTCWCFVIFRSADSDCFDIYFVVTL